MADYLGTGDEGTFGTNKNPLRKLLKRKQEEEKQPVVMVRRNPVYDARSWQMTVNTLALSGGREYVNERLSRYAGESRIDWEGGTRSDGTKVTGRRQQSHAFPYPRRIADKINQHVFSELPKREGANEDFLLDASADGKSVDDLMLIANDYLTSCGWCWIGVDMPSIPEGEQVSIAQKQADKIRPYWQIYSPLTVKDWKTVYQTIN